MKTMTLSLAVAGAMIMASSACNSTKNMSDNSDSTAVDTTTVMPVDTIRRIDTTRKVMPDTLKLPSDTTPIPIPQ